MSSRIALLVVLALVAAVPGLYAQTAPMAESAVEQRPALVPGSCRPPVYPPSLRAAQVEGRVIFQFVVDTLGRIDAASVRTISSTHSYFEDAARRALLSCRYTPARFNNRPVSVTLQLPFNFQLARR